MIYLNEDHTVVVCDECKQAFELNIQTTTIQDGFEKNYFVCRHCQKEYPSHYTNQSIRMKMVDVKMLWRKFHTAESLKKKEKIHAKIKDVQAKIALEMDELKSNILIQSNG